MKPPKRLKDILRFPPSPPNGQAKTQPQARPEPKATVQASPVALADIEAEPIQWLWPGWIPLGMLSILDGDPGLGKSTLTADLAARLTQGWAMPEQQTAAIGLSGVLFLSAEDDLKRVIKPRTVAAGVDQKRAYFLDVVTEGTEERPVVLPDDLPAVEQVVTDKHVRLVIIDPLTAFLSGKIDAHKDSDIRRCLYKLKKLAERTNAAVLLVRHLNKAQGGSALYRGGGSIGITGACRSAMLVGPDPQNEHRRVLASVKTNCGPKPQSLAFALEPEGDVARIGWLGTSELGADDLLSKPSTMGRPGVGQQVADAIRGMLADGPMAVRELDQRLKLMGYTANAVREGKVAAGVRVSRGMFAGDCEASLPGKQ